jgi:hypothetical protein
MAPNVEGKGISPYEASVLGGTQTTAKEVDSTEIQNSRIAQRSTQKKEQVARSVNASAARVNAPDKTGRNI